MISKITNYIIDRFQADEMVHTISLNPINLVDLSKENIYPLVSIKYNGVTSSDDVFLVAFTIHVLQQRDAIKEVQPSKMMEDTNWIDNMNNTFDIAINFVNYVVRMEIDESINVSSIGLLEPLSNFGGANLDGHKFDITFEYPNTGFC